MRPLSIDIRKYGFNIHKYDTGEIVINQKTPVYPEDSPNFNGHRGELHEIVFRYAKDELGIPMHLGHRIQEYFEDETSAGIILEGGKKVSWNARDAKTRLTVSDRSQQTSSSPPMASAPRREKRS
jgi:hypothetical protein